MSPTGSNQKLIQTDHSGLGPSPGIWSQSFSPRSYEVDFEGLATLESLARHFQEAAWNHADALGVGFHRLKAENRIWVLARLSIKVDQYPRWDEPVTVHTWPRAEKSVLAMRDFEMFSANGQRLVAGASAWLLLDMTSRKPQRVDKLTASLNISNERRALEQSPAPLGLCDSATVALAATARYSDIDVNGHVNNTRYIAWLMDSYPISFHQAHAVSLLELNFLAEMRSGDTISIMSKPLQPNEYWHSLRKQPDGIEVCRARITWR